ncbi:MAG: SNF2-related protein [Pirellulaceae bacterium]
MENGLTRSAKQDFLPSDIGRGQQCFLSRNVRLVDIGSQGALGAARGSGGENYDLFLDFSNLEQSEIGVFCECKRFLDNYLCKHVWAMLREIDSFHYRVFESRGNFSFVECSPEDVTVGRPFEIPLRSVNHAVARQDVSPPNALRDTHQPWKRALAAARTLASGKPAAAYSDSLSVKPVRHWFVIRLSDLAHEKQFDLRLYRSRQKADGDWGSISLCTPSLKSRQHVTDAKEHRALALLDIRQEEGYRYHLSDFHIYLHPAVLDETLAALAETERFGWTLDGGQSLGDFHPLRYDRGEKWRFNLRLARSATAGKVEVQPLLTRNAGLEGVVEENGIADSPTEERSVHQVLGICSSGALLFEDHIALADVGDCEAIRVWQRIGELEFDKQELGEFMAELSNSAGGGNLELDSSLEVSVVEGTPVPKLRLLSPQSASENYFYARVLMCYGDQEVSYETDSGSIYNGKNDQLVQRDTELEQDWIRQLSHFPFREDHGRYAYEQTEALRLHRKHFSETITELSNLGWEVEADGNKVRRASDFDIQVESGEDWFDLHANVKFDGQNSSLPALLKALKRGERFVVLDDGSRGILPEEWLNRFGGFATAGVHTDTSVRFQKTQALMLDAMLGEQEEVQFDRKFSNWCKKLKSFSGVKPAKEPRGFKGELREYQRQGVGWFKFLHDFRFGGCLADDMGLGKTVQVLAWLEKRRCRKVEAGAKRKPSIVVVPKSLVFNWVEEAKRFAPKLAVVDYTGTERKARLAEAEDYDVLVTTYSTMRNEIEHLRRSSFDYAILDEAQAIKNPRAQVTKAARLLNADHRLAMTGTPVENHLGDLWSLFDFLNPGMLNGTSAKALASNEDREAGLRAVSKALKPFVLRRTKKEVLTELPEKTEQTLYSEMLPKQVKLYNELRDHYRFALKKKVQQKGLNQSKIHVLEALLRLRQVACDPRLVDPESKVKGAKVELLVQQIKELIEEGHKALVFSQFTSLLALVRQDLIRDGIEFEYLDGKTNQRDKRVKRFQSSDLCSVFLISLKAGGHGLNLTAADYVFILDPWWNPAVEAQAIDRAHRMGQVNPVTAYKMISKDSVEDKILKLQESKRGLAEAIIHSDEGLLKSLTASDLQLLLG